MVVERRPVTFGSLPGVTYWQRRIEEECARAARHGRSFVVALISLSGDGDTGPLARPPADGAMAVAADTLRRSVRTGDVVCGLTPTRFGLLLVETGEEQVGPLIARIMRLLERDVARKLPAAEPPYVSVGYAGYRAGSTPHALTLAVEEALAGASSE